MPTANEFITDYDDNKEDIEYWFSIKCEQKYRRFAELLKNNGEEITWINIRDLYRYDKRLIFNCFRYISFLEEYLRAFIVRNSDEKDSKYVELQEANLSHLIKPIISLYNEGKFEFSGKNLENSLMMVKELRNCISHNRIVLETDCETEFNALRDLLPSGHSKTFVKVIEESRNDLSVSDRWTVHFR